MWMGLLSLLAAATGGDDFTARAIASRMTCAQKVQLATNRPLCQRKTDDGLENSSCKSVEREENHEKASG